MENTAQTKWGIIIGVVFLVVALAVWKMDSPADLSTTEEKTSLLGQDLHSDQGEQEDGMGGPIAEERRVVDIDAVIAEIETASVGDETVLDEEVSDEVQSVQEGRGVIEDLGKSYDETSY